MQHSEDIHQQHYGATAEEQYHLAMQQEQRHYENFGPDVEAIYQQDLLESERFLADYGAAFFDLFGAWPMGFPVNDGFGNYTDIAGDGRVYTMKYVDGGFIKGE